MGKAVKKPAFRVPSYRALAVERRSSRGGSQLRKSASAALDHSRLRGANLRHAKMEGASLWRANLRDADLSYAASSEQSWTTPIFRVPICTTPISPEPHFGERCCRELGSGMQSGLPTNSWKTRIPAERRWPSSLRLSWIILAFSHPTSPRLGSRGPGQ